MFVIIFRVKSHKIITQSIDIVMRMLLYKTIKSMIQYNSLSISLKIQSSIVYATMKKSYFGCLCRLSLSVNGIVQNTQIKR